MGRAAGFFSLSPPRASRSLSLSVSTHRTAVRAKGVLTVPTKLVFWKEGGEGRGGGVSKTKETARAIGGEGERGRPFQRRTAEVYGARSRLPGDRAGVCARSGAGLEAGQTQEQETPGGGGREGEKKPPPPLTGRALSAPRAPRLSFFSSFQLTNTRMMCWKDSDCMRDWRGRGMGEWEGCLGVRKEADRRRAPAAVFVSCSFLLSARAGAAPPGEAG